MGRNDNEFLFFISKKRKLLHGIIVIRKLNGLHNRVGGLVVQRKDVSPLMHPTL
jgi:hypothetical protein